jgi:hypothetical protein
MGNPETPRYRLQTSDMWPKAGPRYYRFLDNIAKAPLPKTLAVLGCADGTYVLPAAKRGFDVLAIDIDKVNLYGGVVSLYGNDVEVIGLDNRAKVEDVMQRITIVCQDCFTYKHVDTYSGVFASGLIHYQSNTRYPLCDILSSIQSYVTPGGLLLLEYIQPSDTNNDPLRHFVTSNHMAEFFPEELWCVKSNIKKEYTENPNPRNFQAHTIVWGRIYAQKNYQ